MSTAAEDAESVDQFLARIASLKDRRDREDEERIRKVEEEILQGRKERQARRAERARSISPSKSSPAPSSSAATESRTMASRPIDPPVELTPSSQTQTPTRSPRFEPNQSPRFSRDFTDTTSSQILPTPPQKSSSTPAPTPPTATSLARSGTLSWQQRPSSRDSNSTRSHPFLGSPAPLSSADLPKNEPDEALSRSQIAKSLGSKDPTFFRQTADRGVGSAAYRRSESEIDSETSLSRSMRLPGMSREPSAEPEKSSNLVSGLAKPQVPVHNSGTAFTRSLDGPSSAVQTNATTPVQSSPLSTPKLAPIELSARNSNGTESSTAAFPGWGSSKRPPSPTKGLGGFVESAMMKRSDSVSKRWSVQAAPGLKRGDSIASNRSTLGAAGAGSLNSGSPPRPTRPIRPLSSSTPTGSRPNSSHEVSKLALPPQNFSPEVPESGKKVPDTTSPNSSPKDAEEVNCNSQAVSSNHVLDQALPVVSTKTLDSRRWSPTKSSWLESALARPESPKSLPSKSEEPAWRSSMHKAKASIGSPPAASFAVTTTSLLRSPPMGGPLKPPSISSMPEAFSSGILEKLSEKSIPATAAKGPSLNAAEGGIVQETRIDTSVDPLLNSKTESIDASQTKQVGESGQKVASPTSLTKRDPPPVKAKPATPPTTNFRATLKPRQTASSEDSNAEPEFKAVFGKLKRTQTKNYVAPNELKDNIAKGKAGLNLTGGPQKTKRVDEFKESILQKKEAMKEGTGLIAKPSIREKPAPTVPEALAKKEAMKAAAGLPAKLPVNETPATILPEALAKRQLLGKSAATAPDSNITPVTSEAQQNVTADTVRRAGPTHSAAKTTTTDAVENPSRTIGLYNVAQTQQTTAPQKQELANSKLASRLNPALAGFLSRGASPKTSNNPSPAASTEDLSLMPRGLNRTTTNESEEAGGTALSHMTKARARGPKRRAPKAGSSIQVTSATATDNKAEFSNSKKLSNSMIASRPLPNVDEALSSETNPGSKASQILAKSEPTPESSSTPRPLTRVRTARDVPEDHEPESLKESRVVKETPKDKPIVVAKSLDLRKVSIPTAKSGAIEDESAIMEPSPELRKVSPPPAKSGAAEPPASPVKDRMRAFDIAQDRSHEPADKPISYTGSWNKPLPVSQIQSPLTPSTTKLNTPKSPSSGGVTRQKPSIIHTTKPISGLGLNLSASSKKEVAPTSMELTPPPEKPQPVSRKLDSSTDGAAEREFIGSEKQQGDSTAKLLFRDLFDQAPRARDKAEFDTQAIMLPNKNLGHKIKTLAMTIWEITGNGKKEPMPAQQEHILFENSMYLCVHTFQPEGGSKSVEAYLWVGDAMSEAAVEDAQLFCRKIARENNARLEVLQQGKETANFFQALGGIVITRRNKHSALYMLCGRRHLGHIAFDEVDLEAASLCSGFPYIISAKFGKLFLWKGRGSGADELGCARLIGMDLGLTGEIEEINEGQEPKAFWESFSSKKRSQSSDLWDLKSTQDAYTCRLYRIGMDRPKSAAGFWGRRGSSPPKSSNKALVEEISPFCQGDLSPHHIYLLDAYFEIYVYAGDQTSSKHMEFVTALMLAQEMSMLAPTLQDRPLMPTCHIVLGDPPKDFKVVLRKWEDERYEKSVFMPLNEAIDALE